MIAAKFHVLGLAAALGCGSVNIAAAADLRGAILANPCAGCHGMDGVSTGSIPSINLLSADAIVAALKAFKSGERPGTVMDRIAKGYTDEEIQRIADYFQPLKNKIKP
ncbi:MAG: cytochrome C [Gammaproteobacteria bacterium]|nr:cytochrome C [Gammaproteobacteria bacterium]